LVKTTAQFVLQTVAAAALLPLAAFGYSGEPAQFANQNAPQVASLVVCDPPAFQSCHRVEGVTPPRVVHSETPVYPLAARRLKLEGVSVVSLVIDPEGVPRNVSIAHSIAESVPAPHHDVAMEMDKSAVACVKKFRFVAATLDGKPVATQGKVKMNFHHTMGN
jgi:TonB family protein